MDEGVNVWELAAQAGLRESPFVCPVGLAIEIAEHVTSYDSLGTLEEWPNCTTQSVPGAPAL